MGKENRGSKAKAAATTRHDGGGREEVGESNTEGDVPATTSSANPGANTHEGRHPYVFREGELVNVNVGKASHQADIVLIKDEMATVKWKTWKGHAEVEVNQLRLICDGSKRKRKQTDQFGQPRGDMTDADTTKKLKPAATVARSESLKDLSTLVCYVCNGDVWSKNGRWTGGYCVEKKVHVCCYCKILAMQKQARLAKGESVKDKIWDHDSSDEEEDAEESLVPKEIEESLIIQKNIHRPHMRLPLQHHLASDGAVPGCQVGAIPAANISSALTTLIWPLMAEERRVVVGATTKGIGLPCSEILVSQGGDFVQRGSMQTLRPGIWLNDKVINYILKNCLKRRDIKICAKEPGRRWSHFFNSFFVQTMFD